MRNYKSELAVLGVKVARELSSVCWKRFNTVVAEKCHDLSQRQEGSLNKIRREAKENYDKAEDTYNELQHRNDDRDFDYQRMD
jgi:hypothetical protein